MTVLFRVLFSTFVMLALLAFGNIALGDGLTTIAGTGSAIIKNSADFSNVATTTTSIDVSNIDKVLVIASFEVERTQASVSRIVYFRITDDYSTPNISGEIMRTLENGSEGGFGIGSLVYVFDVSGITTGSISYSLQHKNPAGQNITTNASIVAMALNTTASPYSALNSNMEYLSSESATSSTDYVGITGLTTDGILLPTTGGMMVAASINCQRTNIGTNPDAGTWILQQKKGINGTWGDVGSGVQRSMSTTSDAGIVTLYYFTEDQPRDYYYYRVAQKVSVGTGVTIETLTGSTIAAVALSYVESNVGYRFKIESTSGSGNTTSNIASDAITAITATPSGTNALVLAQFAIAGTLASVSTYNLYTTTGSISSINEQRTISSASDKGAGGIVGLATVLSGSIDFSLQHSTTAGTLTTSNIQLGVLNLTDSYSPGYWIGGTSTVWNIAGNWSDGIPNSSTNVTIYEYTNAPIIAATAACNNLVIAPDATLTVNSEITLTVSDDLVVESGGSFINNGTTTVTGDVKATRYVNKDIWHYISSPVTGQNIDADFMTNNDVYSPNSGTNYNFYRWNEPTNDWFIFGDGSFADGSFADGRGYAVTFATDRYIEFSGTLNTSDIDATVYKTGTSGYEGSNLLGNPFLSPISLSAFTDSDINSYIEGTVYFWSEGSWTYPSDNYAYWNLTGKIGNGTQIPSDQIGVAQGFMVYANTTDATVNFNTNMQTHANPNYFKQSDIASIKLSIQYQDDFYNETLIAMMEDATLGFDRDYDARKLLGDASLYLYTEMPDANQALAIQGVPFPEESPIIIPLVIDVSVSGEFVLSVVDIQNIDVSMDVLLEDTQSDEFYDLKEEEDIILQLSEGNYNSRFYLHISNATGVDEINKSEDIYTYTNGNKLYIINPQRKTGNVKIFNLAGQEITTFRLTGDNTQQQTLNVNDIINVVQIQTDNEIISNKVIFK